MGDDLRAVKRQKRAEEEHFERTPRRRLRKGLFRGPEDPVIIADRKNGGLLRPHRVGPQEIVPVGGRVGQNEISQAEGDRVDAEIPPGRQRRRRLAAPVQDLGLVAGGQRIEDDPAGGQQAEQLGQGNVFRAELGHENKAAERGFFVFSSGPAAPEEGPDQEWIPGPEPPARRSPAFPDDRSVFLQAAAKDGISGIGGIIGPEKNDARRRGIRHVRP